LEKEATLKNAKELIQKTSDEKTGNLKNTHRGSFKRPPMKKEEKTQMGLFKRPPTEK
jgi:hypothetical protein